MCAWKLFLFAVEDWDKNGWMGFSWISENFIKLLFGSSGEMFYVKCSSVNHCLLTDLEYCPCFFMNFLSCII